jgi:putative ABC transport system ATP-binding protein
VVRYAIEIGYNAGFPRSDSVSRPIPTQLVGSPIDSDGESIKPEVGAMPELNGDIPRGADLMGPVVRLEQVTKEYPAGGKTFKAVTDISLGIDQGEFVLILGPSGSGKTTLLNLISALIRPTTGKIFVNGSEISAISDKEATGFRAKNIGLVFQFFNLFPALTAIENVEIGAALKIKDSRQLRDRAVKYLKLVGLEGMENKYPAQLSGGEQQRVAVARALAMEPRILLADEPTGNLDAETGEGIWNLLNEMNETTGTTIIAVTHWSEAAKRAHRTIRLRSGKIEKIEHVGD